MDNNKIKNLIKSATPLKLLNKIRFKRYMKFFTTNRDSYLVKKGYIKSFYQSEPVNYLGNPVPWMNYSVVEFLNNRLNENLNMFEYGSGNSTIYFSSLVKYITSIEYNIEWYNRIKGLLEKRENIRLIYQPLGEDYINAIRNISKGENLYEVITIDGSERVKCAKIAMRYLTKNGVLILDNSERERYKEIFIFYKDAGFKEITISGMVPNGFYVYYTTIFYRIENILKI